MLVHLSNPLMQTFNVCSLLRQIFVRRTTIHYILLQRQLQVLTQLTLRTQNMTERVNGMDHFEATSTRGVMIVHALGQGEAKGNELDTRRTWS